MTATHTVDYLAYLESPEWAVKRTRILQRDGHSCTLCMRNDATDVHHRTYANLGAERTDDLTSLCAMCHQYVGLVAKGVPMSHPALLHVTRELIAEITLRHLVQSPDVGKHHWEQIMRVIGCPESGPLPAWLRAAQTLALPATT